MGGADDGDDDRDDPDREAILARRKKLIAVALAGLTSAAACGDDAEPTTCLRMAADSGMGMDAAAGDSGTDAGPAVCLDIAIDAGDEDAGDLDDGGRDIDAEPMACLTPKLRPDGGDGDAA